MTRLFPSEERYSLVAQMRRASASIGTNIAEGCGHHSDSELIRFLQIAMGSASELEYQLLLAHDLGLIDAASHARLWRRVAEVRRMLASLLRTLRARSGRRAYPPRADALTD